MKRKLYFWIIAVLLTLIAAVYQRVTGPTYPKKIKITLNAHEIKGMLPRSGTTGANTQIELGNVPENITATLFYKRFPTNDIYISEPFEKKGSNIVAFLPSQLAAGKLAYYIQLDDGKNPINIFDRQPVVIRFKGDVPTIVLIPHIFFIFFAMLLSTLAGIFALGKVESYKFWSWMALSFLFLGGMIFGPIVQFYAFGEAWTGFPIGYDLTDNKTLIAFLAWLVALLLNWKKERPILIVGAAAVLLIIFSIPHSVMGSQLNYDSGKIVTGLISVLHIL
jgi:hypothetical protein